MHLKQAYLLSKEWGAPHFAKSGFPQNKDR